MVREPPETGWPREVPSPAAIQAQLAKLLQTRPFSDSPRQKRFLDFSVSQSLEGAADRLKEYTIGLEVFDKAPTFDPRLDSTVRTAAKRLRDNLKTYYETDGKTDPVLIELPEGHYVPRFSSRAPANDHEKQKVARTTNPRKSRLTRVRGKVGIAGAFVGLMIVAWSYREKNLTLASGHTPTVEQPAHYPDREVAPTFDPNGDQVAFYSSGGTQPNNNIFRKPIDGGTTVRLTSGSDDDRNPSWSPDGKLIAFIRNVGPHGAVYLVTPQGENRGKLIDTQSAYVAWYPNSRYLALMDHRTDERPCGISLVELATRRKLPLIPPSPQRGCGAGVSFSPDGKTLAFLGSTELFVSRLNPFVSPPAASDPEHLTHDRLIPYGFAWMPDSRDIVLSADRGSGPTLWRIPVPYRSEPRRLQFEGLYAHLPAISRPGPGKPIRLAYEYLDSRVNMWRINLSDARRAVDEPQRFAPSSRGDAAPQFSHDGRRIVFTSSRGGRLATYLCDANGANIGKLSLPNESGSARWSPDDREIAFDSTLNGNRKIYVAELNGPVVRRLTTEPSEAVRPTWSRDGRWIYFGSDRIEKGIYQIWKMRSDGTGEMIQVTRHGGFEGFESWDGKFLYYVKENGKPGLWRIPAEGGIEVPILDSVVDGHWAIADDGIFFVDFGGRERSRIIKFFSFANSRTEFVYRTELDAVTFFPGFSATRDGRSLLVSLQANQNSEIIVVNNFELK